MGQLYFSQGRFSEHETEDKTFHKSFYVALIINASPFNSMLKSDLADMRPGIVLWLPQVSKSPALWPRGQNNGNRENLQHYQQKIEWDQFPAVFHTLCQLCIKCLSIIQFSCL